MKSLSTKNYLKILFLRPDFRYFYFELLSFKKNSYLIYFMLKTLLKLSKD